MRISDWSSDVCSSDLKPRSLHRRKRQIRAAAECRGPADDAAARPRGREIARHVGPADWDTPEMVTFFRQHLSRDSGALRPHDATKARKRVVSGKSVSVRVDPGGIRVIKKKNTK